MASVTDTVDYFKDDFPKGLFPLDTNRIVVKHSAQELSKYVYENILNDNEDAHHFLPQDRCHAAKHGLHLG